MKQYSLIVADGICDSRIHRGSGFSGTIATIAELEPEATVIEDGFTFPGDNAADAAKDVAAWLKELDY